MLLYRLVAARRFFIARSQQIKKHLTAHPNVGGAKMEIEVIYHVYDIRLKENLSSRKLAEISGISKSTINNIENNRYDPTIKTICMIAEALKVDPEKLYSYKLIS